MQNDPDMERLSLYQPVTYLASGAWHPSWTAAVESCSAPLTWDSAAIMSTLCFNYACGDRTLVNEIKRQPWLSQLDDNPKPRLAPIPPHDFVWMEPPMIADRLERLLMEEAMEACRGRKNIYVLLSGGLDSRVVAGILAKLYKIGRLSVKPVAVTWGFDQSRDIAYSKAVADILDFQWIHIPLGPDALRENIDLAAEKLGGLVSPLHLHAMSWFKNVEKDAIVLAGSYGDSIGRAEFSNRHLLEISPLKPSNAFDLVHSAIARQAQECVMRDLGQLRSRAGECPSYAHCEHEMQGHYMRGMIAHCMNIINDYCTLYQMFTAHSVFSFMWSLHPVCRDNRTYAILLDRLDPKLLQLPWARTNKAIAGPTIGRQRGLRPEFHDYSSWIRGPLRHEYVERIDPLWFSQIGIFDSNQISKLRDRFMKPKGVLEVDYSMLCEKIAWLACFRRFSEIVGRAKIIRHVDDDQRSVVSAPVCTTCRVNYVRKLLRNIKTVYQLNKRLRLAILKRRCLAQYPPVRMSE